MTDYENEFKAVLGPLFDELSELTPASLTLDKMLTDLEKSKIRESMYMVQIPFSGSFALELAAALDHTVCGCLNCAEYLSDFATRFIVSLWDTILMSMEVEDE
jgi:hypothetical protein